MKRGLSIHVDFVLDCKLTWGVSVTSAYSEFYFAHSHLNFLEFLSLKNKSGRIKVVESIWKHLKPLFLMEVFLSWKMNHVNGN